MSFFFKNKEKDKFIFVLDIRSSSVGGAVFLMSENKAPKIVFTVREKIPLIEKVNLNKFLALTLKSLDNVLNKIHQQGFQYPKKIICSLSSPWYLSQTRIISYTKNTPFIFNNKLADDLIEKDIKLFESEYLKKYRYLNNGIKLLEFKNMKILLNGYPCEKPLNQKANDLQMTVYLSVAEKNTLDKFQKLINKYYSFEDIKFISFLRASFGVSRNIFVHDDSFLLVDIGGEITDISMVKKDVLRSSISFPLGKNFFIRGIKEKLNCSNEEAFSFFNLYQQKHLNNDMNNTLNTILIELKNKWINSFQESLASITNDISIPSIIFITIDEDWADFFIQIIKTEQFNQYSLTDSKFRIVFLGNQALHGIAFFDKNIYRDPFLTLIVIYINDFIR